MRVLGIDPGTRFCGWGIVEARQGSRIGHVAHGVIATKASEPVEKRLVVVHAELAKVIAEHRPEAASVEEVFFAANVKSALVLGHARGVAMLVAAQHGLTVASYAASMVKQAVVGTGRAEKEQVARMVSVILGVPGFERSDASDALALAITHVTRGTALRLLAR